MSLKILKSPGEKENVINEMVLWFLFNLVHRFLYLFQALDDLAIYTRLNSITYFIFKCTFVNALYEELLKFLNESFK